MELTFLKREAYQLYLKQSASWIIFLWEFPRIIEKPIYITTSGFCLLPDTHQTDVEKLDE